MSTLLGKLIKDSYGDLLQISNSNYGIDATSRYIEDGEGTPSVLSLSTTRVGIGTTSPGNMLEINAGTGTNVGMTLRMGSGLNGYNDSFISFQNSQGGELFRTRFDNDSANERYVISSDQGGDILTVSRSGDVGIGVTNPDHQLTIKSSLNHGCVRLMTAASTDNHIRYDYPSDSSKYWLVGADQSGSLADSFIVYNAPRNNVDLIIDQATGNVGIGTTTNPTAKLEIFGDSQSIKFTRNQGDRSGEMLYDGSVFLIKAPHSDRLSIADSSSSELFTVNPNSGNVGIGTTNPDSKLTIFNTGAASVDAITLDWEHLTASGGLEQRIKWRFGDDATPDALSDAGYIAMGKYSWNTGASRSSYISFATVDGINQIQYGGTEPDYTPVERMRISKEGKVGIGTTNPDQLLQVSSTTNVAARFNMIDGSFTNWLTIGCSVDTAATKFTSSTDGFHFDTGDAAGANSLIIHQDGKVGIGKKTPSTRLDAVNDFERIRMSITSNSGPGQVAINPSSGSILVLAHVARAANTNSNRSYLLLVNTRNWSFGGGNNVSVVNSTGSSTGTTGEPTASFGLTGSANSHYLTCSVTAIGGVQEEYYVSLRVISLGPNGL